MSWKEQLIVKLSTLLKVNLLGLAYKSRGIGLPVDFRENGELFFLRAKLLNLIGEKKEYHFFDVGQNNGEYTDLLLELDCNSTIHGFEPNQYLFKDLLNKYKDNKRLRLNNQGLGSKESTNQLFLYKNNIKTSHGSLYEKVFNQLHDNFNIIGQTIEITTIEDYCSKNDISSIDFLKIDVEGSELEVLKGAGTLLDSINIIQFEFNEMNTVSRVFMRDFYNLLEGFSFFRITPSGLFPLGKYSSKNEIFVIQNIVAIKK